MSIIGADDVLGAKDAGILHVPPGAVITPLAAERARDLGVELVVTSEQVASSGAGNGAADRHTPQLGPPPVAQPRTPAMYRRVLTPEARGGPVLGGAGRRVVVVGAGNVGTSTAQHLAMKGNFDEIVLVDTADGLAAGKALDLCHAASLLGFRTRISGETSVAQAGPADYTIVTAGRARTPGMTRTDLTEVNAAIVRSVCQDIASTSPGSVIVVVTNPLDEMAHLAWRSSEFPSDQVIGMAGVLDTARFKALLALEPEIDDASALEAYALGSHGAEMVVPLSTARFRGAPLTGLIDAVRLDAIVERTRNSGGEVVGLLGTGSAFVTPGIAAAEMVLAMAAGSKSVMPCTVLANGAYGIGEVYVGLPSQLGRGGLERIVDLSLDSDELAALQNAAERIDERVSAIA